MFPEVRRKKKSLREVLPQKTLGRAVAKNKEEKPVAPPRQPKSPRNGRGLWGYILVIVIILAVVAYALSSLMAKATVTITPRRANLTLAESLTATRSQAAAGALTYEVVTLPAIKLNRIVPASGSKLVTEKATGQVVISNNFSSASQLLVANTRLEAADGRIYRLVKTVTVPGQKTIAGKKMASTIAADIIAGSPGESYNSQKELSFTLPGLKGGPRYAAITAKSKGAINGGSSGQIKVVPEETKTKVGTELKQELRDQLLAAARGQIPPEFILFDDGLILNFKDETDWSAASGGNEVTIVWSGELRGLIFERQKLSTYVIGNKLPELVGLDLLITNLDRLAFILNRKEQIDLVKETRISFGLSGEAEVVAQVDSVTLASKLVGVKKNVANQVLGQFKEIEKAAVVLQPPWARHFPAKASDIVVVDAIN